MRSIPVSAVALLVAAACTSDAPGETNSEAASTIDAHREITFIAQDNSFEGPDTVEAGMVTLVLKNEGPEWHHLQLIRLPDEMTMEGFQTAMAEMQPGTPPPPWLREAGGVNPPEPGAEARVTQMLTPGEYAVICLVDTPDRIPHVAKGMISSLTVVPSDESPAPPPESDLTLTLVDYAFSFSEPPTAGEHVIKVENSAQQAHEIAFFRLLPGKTMDDFGAWGANYEGPAPITAVGGVPGIHSGQVAYVHVEFTPGDYVAACFVPDAKDGKMHLEHGMVMPFTVS